MSIQRDSSVSFIPSTFYVPPHGSGTHNINLVPNFRSANTDSVINYLTWRKMICCCMFVRMLYLRQCPLQPAASRADDLAQRTEHLTQEILHRGHQHTVNPAQYSPTVHMQLTSASLLLQQNTGADTFCVCYSGVSHDHWMKSNEFTFTFPIKHNKMWITAHFHPLAAYVRVFY